MQLVNDVLDGGGRRPDGVVGVAVELRIGIASLLVVLFLVFFGRLGLFCLFFLIKEKRKERRRYRVSGRTKETSLLLLSSSSFLLSTGGSRRGRFLGEETGTRMSSGIKRAGSTQLP